MRNARLIIPFAAALGTAFLVAGNAMAARAPHRTVTVQGDFQDQRITAPVRKTDNGEEVLAPGGGWKNCGGDCRQALKDSTFDFWNTQEGSQSGQMSQ
jgi:hypothetical protein